MAFRRAAAGGAELVVLSGPAGIGKTTLVRQMRAPLGQQLGYFIAGKFDQLQRDVPFSAIVAALHDLVRQLLDGEPGADARVARRHHRRGRTQRAGDHRSGTGAGAHHRAAAAAGPARAERIAEPFQPRLPVLPAGVLPVKTGR